MKMIKVLLLTTITICLIGCSRKLDLKPESTLVLPETVKDFENLLSNTQIMNSTPGLPQLSADEYVIPTKTNYDALVTPITRTAYTWQQDIYEGKPLIADWTRPYAQVFICNSILDVLQKKGIEGNEELANIKGWALFCRAYAFYSLVSTFSKAYDENSSDNDLGIPLKLNSAVTEIVQRNTVKQTYDQIIKDASAAATLLQQNIIPEKRNRPSQIAAYAFLARVYLSMRKYDLAEICALKTLDLHPNLTDYNTLTIRAAGSSFSGYNNEETIYFTYMNITAYSQTTYETPTLYMVNPQFINLYADSDLRKKVYFSLAANGNYGIKGINTPTSIPFTGLATDEMYFIKAECLARKGEIQASMTTLNAVLKKRWNPNLTSTPTPYQDISASGISDAIGKVLVERKKQLIWRSVRWTDLKRLNLEGKNIVLARSLGDQTYTLEPNSSKYVLPIPEDEIALSGIIQNPR